MADSDTKKRRNERREQALVMHLQGADAATIAVALGCCAGTVYELLRESRAAGAKVVDARKGRRRG